MKVWIESADAYNIYQELKASQVEVFPFAKDVWKAFQFVNLAKLKAVVVAQSPYHTHENGVPYADGKAFSCSLTKKLSPSLSVLYDAIDNDLGVKVERTPDLEYLAFQDVLLLNTCLTIDKGDQKSFDKHNVLWQPFIKYLFEQVLDTCTGIPILLFGKAAEEQIVPYLKEGSHLWKCIKHPAYYARKEMPMETDGCFKWMSDVIKDNNGEELYWNYADYNKWFLPF
jgi:uracil-DNA glycosylase